MSASTDKSDEEKQEFLREHFFYEVQMLQGILLYRPNITRISDIAHQFKDNLVLEVFLLHARNLYEFFYFQPKQHYARAEQFSEEGKPWKDLKPKKTEAIRKLQARAPYEVVHLTWRRVSGQPPEKVWWLTPLCNDLMTVVRVFLTNVPERYLDQKLIRLRETGKSWP